MGYAFEAEGLVKRFGKTVALAGVDFAAEPGTVLGVLGPNGAGKTTATRILATLLRPDGGRAMVHGLDVVREAARVRRMIGLTGQYASVDEDLSGMENLVLIGQLLDLSRSQARARAADLLERFDLSEAAPRRVHTYSGGMRRRLDLAACLVGHPRVVYLDEPTTGLDPGKREDVWRMIRSIADEGRTVLLTTQYLEEADTLADDVIVIDHGTVIAHGSPAQLKQVVGGQTITIRAREPDRVGEVAAMLAAVTNRSPELVGRDAVTVAVDDDAIFTEAVRRLAAAGVGVTEVWMRLPSLDEAFFALTGRHTDQPQPMTKEQA